MIKKTTTAFLIISSCKQESLDSDVRASCHHGHWSFGFPHKRSRIGAAEVKYLLTSVSARLISEG